MNCKSKEQKTLREIKNSVTGILNEMEGYYTSDSEAHDIGFYMAMLRNTINYIQKEEDKAKDKNAKFTCSHCESNKIYVCSPCMDDMAKQYDNYPN